MGNTRKDTTRKKRFKTFSFKLSPRQYNSLQNYCTKENTTPIKLIKKQLKEFTENYSDEQIGKEKIAKNQLELFKQLSPEEQQLKMFNA